MICSIHFTQYTVENSSWHAYLGKDIKNLTADIADLSQGVLA